LGATGIENWAKVQIISASRVDNFRKYLILDLYPLVIMDKLSVFGLSACLQTGRLVFEIPAKDGVVVGMWGR